MGTLDTISGSKRNDLKKVCNGCSIEFPTDMPGTLQAVEVGASVGHPALIACNMGVPLVLSDLLNKMQEAQLNLNFRSTRLLFMCVSNIAWDTLILKKNTPCLSQIYI